MTHETNPSPKRKRGRPSNAERAITSTGEHWADRMLRCYEEGYSDDEICRDLRIPKREFERRIREDADFAQLVEIGRLFSKAWWITQGRVNLRDRAFNFSLWFATMKNRFGWADKVDMTAGDDKPLDQKSEDELKADLLQKHKHRLAKLLNADDATLAGVLTNGLN